MTIRQATEKIASLGYYSAAKWATAHALGLDNTDFILSLDREISSGDSLKIEEIICRLKNHEPMQYVLGRWQFIDIEVKTDARALIPRPETELLALKAVEYAKANGARRIADIGCGTGCIGLYIKHCLPETDVTLCDISSEAISLAGENAEALGLECNFIKKDMRKLEKLPCDIMVSNPPYIKTDDIKTLEPNVRDYEPHMALDGGTDGLDCYRALARLAEASLGEGGAVLAEVGIGQSNEVPDIFSAYFKSITLVKDFSGIDRIVIAERG